MTRAHAVPVIEQPVGFWQVWVEQILGGAYVLDKIPKGETRLGAHLNLSPAGEMK